LGFEAITAVAININIPRDVAPLCLLTDTKLYFPEDGDSTILRNVHSYPTNHNRHIGKESKIAHFGLNTKLYSIEKYSPTFLRYDTDRKENQNITERTHRDTNV
jgi:hypothetical protein